MSKDTALRQAGGDKSRVGVGSDGRCPPYKPGGSQVSEQGYQAEPGPPDGGSFVTQVKTIYWHSLSTWQA